MGCKPKTVCQCCFGSEPLQGNCRKCIPMGVIQQFLFMFVGIHSSKSSEFPVTTRTLLGRAGSNYHVLFGHFVSFCYNLRLFKEPIHAREIPFHTFAGSIQFLWMCSKIFQNRTNKSTFLGDPFYPNDITQHMVDLFITWTITITRKMTMVKKPNNLNMTKHVLTMGFCGTLFLDTPSYTTKFEGLLLIYCWYSILDCRFQVGHSNDSNVFCFPSYSEWLRLYQNYQTHSSRIRGYHV
jgi:hypothetical protein